jgi:hypothetical protein
VEQQQQQQQQRQRPASDPSGLRQAVEAREGQLVRQAAQLAAQQLEVEQLRHERDELSARLAAQEEVCAPRGYEHRKFGDQDLQQQRRRRGRVVC